MGLYELFVSSILNQNMALVMILGMCPLIAISTDVKSAFGMGVAVLLVVTLTALINWPIYELLKLTNTTDLALLVFMIVIASSVQLLEMVLEKYFPALHGAFGIFLPLITVNCIVLAISLFMSNRDYSFAQSAIFSIGSGIGWLIAIVLLAGLRVKQNPVNDSPRGLKGKGIAFIMLGVMALAFIGFTGLV